MNLITETIEWLQNLSRERVVEVNGRKYVETGSGINPLYDPTHPTLSADLTLTGLIDYININPDGNTDENFIIIESYRKISLVTAPYSLHRQRDLLAEAAHKSWYQLEGPDRGALRTGVESMIVMLLTCFEPNDDRKYLLNLISNIKIDDETRIEDDGLTQTVAVKAGITTVEKQDVRRLITLRPRITFPEIAQPNIMYTVRLEQSRGGSEVGVKLFPQEDVTWQGEVADSIRNYISQNTDQPIQIIR